MKLEDALNQLDVINKALEQPELPLEEALQQYEKGLQLIKQSTKIIDAAEKRIIQLSDGDVSPSAHGE
jgi:exodeoxyribonuclease VII small subunit